ncbi:MAG: hypothetical protein JST80_00880 [Bdellovibrionales bacterium]|nr:hypothetical protein [Bdellovibrionales bacterium]
MRTINYISLIVMIAASFFTWSAIASPAPARDLASTNKVHLLNNLDPADLKLVMKVMEERGYVVVTKGIFTEADKTITVTKALADETDPASIEISVLKLEKDNKLPKTVFNHKVITDDMTKALEALPKPGELPILGKKE